jgi:hypothetical protein
MVNSTTMTYKRGYKGFIFQLSLDISTINSKIPLEYCKSTPRTYDIMTHIPGAGTATNGRWHNHPRRQHSHW